MKNTLVLVTFASLTLLSACAVKPKASFTTPQQKVAAPATVQFSNTSIKADQYEWDFGDGSAVSTEANPTHRYMHSGNFNVVLKATAGNKTTTYKQTMQVTAPERCLIEIQTSQGNMIAELFSATPKHRDNFVKLAEEGYFDDLLFHRVIAGFMVQGGDPNSRGAKPGQQLGFGGPSYKVPAEFVDSLVHVKGSLAAARDGNPQKASSASQFYIVQGSGPIGDDQLNMLEAQKGFRYSSEQREAYKTLGGTPFLDRDYTVFGRIIEGLEIVDKIAGVKTGPNDRPVEDVKMKIRVIK
ncbi:MAG: peptidylprolyl isomerase [Chitinophagales bacterium]|jgi:cyclophilin family peptidyl-prolyl cis-trans isomerase